MGSLRKNISYYWIFVRFYYLYHVNFYYNTVKQTRLLSLEYCIKVTTDCGFAYESDVLLVTYFYLEQCTTHSRWPTQLLVIFSYLVIISGARTNSFIRNKLDDLGLNDSQ